MNNSISPRSLQEGEFVVHKKYGVGRFTGIKTVPPSSRPPPFPNARFPYTPAHQTAGADGSAASYPRASADGER